MTAILVIVSFLFMEFVAWSNHKYIMHGFMWKFHKDHHVSTTTGIKTIFEKNDIFFLIYAVPAIILIITGLMLGSAYPVAIGAGITLYGFTYFMIHDVVYHQRLPLFTNSRNPYIIAIKRAHDAHHRPSNKNDFNNFGLLVFSTKYFK
jgi:beta-carotene 3-hydroxylase